MAGSWSPAAGAHHQAFQRGEAHGGVHGNPGAHRVGAGPVADVQQDQVGLEGVLAQQHCGPLGHVQEGGAVKAVAAHPVLGVPGVGQGVEVGRPAAWSGARRCPSRRSAARRAARPAPPRCPGCSAGCAAAPGPASSLKVARAASSMTTDWAKRSPPCTTRCPTALIWERSRDGPVLRVGEHGQDQLQGDLVVRAVLLLLHLALALGVVLDEAAADGHPLDDALGEDFPPVPAVELVFERGAAAVQCENIHISVRRMIAARPGLVNRKGKKAWARPAQRP